MLLTLLTIIFIVVSILLVAIILLQPHHSESGLAGAFGGGGSESFFGTKAVSVATKITVVLAIIFILLVILLNKIPRKSGSIMSDQATKTSAPAQLPIIPDESQPVTATGTTTSPPTTSASGGPETGNKTPLEIPPAEKPVTPEGETK
ncbi:MAG: preprotein translocase subunit SecG [Planctomycetota bacterium]